MLIINPRPRTRLGDGVYSFWWIHLWTFWLRKYFHTHQLINDGCRIIDQLWKSQVTPVHKQTLTGTYIMIIIFQTPWEIAQSHQSCGVSKAYYCSRYPQLSVDASYGANHQYGFLSARDGYPRGHRSLWCNDCVPQMCSGVLLTSQVINHLSQWTLSRWLNQYQFIRGADTRTAGPARGLGHGSGYCVHATYQLSWVSLRSEVRILYLTNWSNIVI